jgi:hypothetical protein
MISTVDQIIANGLDLAGGSLQKFELDDDFATLNALNIIDSMMLELAQSGKQTLGYKTTFTVGANTNTGTVVVSAFALGEKFVRYRRQVTDRWSIIDVVDDIEDLTEKQNRATHAICLQGAVSPATYFLSWTPAEDTVFELWGKSIAAEITDLNAAIPLPPEFGLLVAYRVADTMLNQLLIHDAKAFQPFVIAQKGSLQRERDRLEYQWRAFLVMPADAGRSQRVRPYDLTEDLDTAFDDIETVSAGEHVS